MLEEPLECFVPGLPVAQGSMRAMPIKGGGATLLQGSSKRHRDQLADWRHAIRSVVCSELLEDEPPFAGPVAIRATFGVVRPKSHPKTRQTWPIGHNSGDIDKLTRAVLDALTGVVWLDDSQVIRAVVGKTWSERPGVNLYICEGTLVVQEAWRGSDAI